MMQPAPNETRIHTDELVDIREVSVDRNLPEEERIAAFIRLSYTDDHSSESDSVSNQRKLIENFVERNPDIEVVSEKIDDGY